MRPINFIVIGEKYVEIGNFRLRIILFVTLGATDMYGMTGDPPPFCIRSIQRGHVNKGLCKGYFFNGLSILDVKIATLVPMAPPT